MKIKCGHCSNELDKIILVCDVKYMLDEKVEAQGNLWKHTILGRNDIIIKEEEIINGIVHMNGMREEFNIEPLNIVGMAIILVCPHCKLGLENGGKSPVTEVIVDSVFTVSMGSEEESGEDYGIEDDSKENKLEEEELTKKRESQNKIIH